jgi:radical SAM family uncharacterized protein/radical SAM-linked protein
MERILPYVRKPMRYLGNELGSAHKDWDEVGFRFAISYPDLYEIGMSYLGLRVIYHLLNSRDDTLCERVFTPAVDAEELMRKNGVPLCSLESGRPLKEFDCFGFSLQYELVYTNVLNMLELADIPIHREERKESDPLVVVGGSCALNPGVLSRFFDCLFVGEAEVVLPEFVELAKQWKSHELSRQELLVELSKVPGIFVPGVSESASRVWCEELTHENFPSSWIVPFVETVQDTLVIEIARGCTRGCRFCQPGMATRPYRERDVNAVMRLIKDSVARTGYRKVSLLSLSASDHSQFIEIVKRATRLNLNVSLPSLLASSLTEDLANLIGRGGITLAPEVGTDRLRQRINKGVTESQVLESCEIAASHGFTHVKLYYMIGLPGETEADIEGIVDLTLRISKVLKGKQINITLSPFVPKPHTPFQWEAQESQEQLVGKIDYVRSRLRRRNIKIKSTNLRSSIMEGICARGDDRIAQVVEEAYRYGAKFDGWGDKFDFSLWEKAFEKVGVDPHEYLGQRQVNGSLPWDAIDAGVKNEFMLEERSKTAHTQDCRIQGCYGCGVCQDAKRIVPIHRETQSDIFYGRTKRQKPLSKLRLKFRVKFEKTERLRFLGHLDLVQAISRAIVRADIPIAYSEGFTKRPKLAFSPPLPFGVTSREEYFDMTLESIPSGDFRSVLNRSLPSGLEVLEVTKLWKEARALSEELKKCDYRAEGATPGKKRIEEFMSQEEVLAHDMNIRPFVLDAEEIDGSLVLRMKIGKAKPWWIVEYLLGISETEALGFKIERIRYCQPQKDTEKHRM